jgi:alpha-2-macroglobulin
MTFTAKLAALAGLLAAAAVAGSSPADRQQARKLMDDGNYAEALDQLREITLAEVDNPSVPESTELVDDYRRTLNCYQQLGRLNEIDEYREAVVERHEQDWRVLGAVAQSYLDYAHHGFMIAGEFRRGDHRGGGEVAHVTARDRVRALQLFRQALAIVVDDADAQKTSEAFALASGFASALMPGGYYQAWRLQVLTDLNELPDHEPGWGDYNSGTRGAPVDEDSNPLLYAKPATWDDAKNDGERWRWILAQRTAWQPETKRRELRERADFLASQFSVRTMADYGWWFARRADDADVTKSAFDLHTLGEDETIARLATGIKRFKLADEHNPIALYKLIAEKSQRGDGEWQGAFSSLAQEFEDRRQYPRAAELWKELAAAEPTNASYTERFTQIVGNWGRLEQVPTQRSGRGATLDYRYRNGKRVEFTARPVKVRLLLDDVKAYLKSNPAQVEWNQLNIEQLGYKLVVDGQEKYLGEEAAKWSLDLEPRPEHFDRRVTVTTPLQQPGAYLVTARMDGGNVHRVVMWTADTAIVKKPLQGKALYYVADAVTGKPVPKCNVEFFGYRQEQIDGTNRYRVLTKNFANFTSDNGLVELPAAEDHHAWLAIASNDAGRLAYVGFSGVWSGEYYDQQYQQVKVYAITDRPVYRPGHKVHFKFWVATAKFDQPDASEFAAQSFLVEIHDPRGEKVYTKSLVADAYGGLSGSYTLPAGATLGQYQTMVVNHGGGGFRVEEYKKPEYEVKIDAPTEPVQLGDKITATIKANYYFGAPVVNARVKYKVLRTTYSEQWFPPGPWDWLYGPGYWWFAEDYTWYPGWARWGCARPYPWWFWRAPQPPEIVAENEAEIGPDGTLRVEIDTATAKEFHPDNDHSYQIQAEVVDESRRTIVADGQVLVARQPFRVYVWAHRGYYRAGQTIELDMAARTLDGKPLKGSGVLRLLKIAYEEGKPVENEVGKWTVPTDEQGQATLQIKASEPGQYRVAYEVTAKSGAAGAEAKKIEGGQMLTVRGENFDGTGFRFNSVELVPDKREYAPGDKVRLQVSANRAGAAVLLFLRPANGIYLPPQVVRLTGKTTVVEVEVADRDTPNFFVEAVTVHGGKMHTAVREIFVPPAKRVFHVAVEPSAKDYLPGQRASVKLKLTDADGKPIVGSTVVAIYDKALDYIAGDARFPDIREFFWKWRRNHNPQNETNLARTEGPVVKPNQPEMQNLGAFGESTADEDEVVQERRTLGGRGGAARFGLAMDAMADGAVAAAAPMAAAAPESAMQKSAEGEEAGGAAPLVEPSVRQEFADTALWKGTLETGADGTAEVELDMPENLTTWKVHVWGMGRGTRVGQGDAEVVTRKNIIVRLQAPRFFVERDEVVLSANVHNYLKEAKQVTVRLELEGDSLRGPGTLEEKIEIPADGEKRIDWRVSVVREGQAVIRMSALTDEESDAMQMTFPVFVHGMLKTDSFSGAMRPADKTGSFTFTVPEERRPEQSRLEIRYSPTLAGAMVDALPYLADYPYGCTEQTLNRFLPAVLAQRTLQRMGVDLKEIQEKRANLNAQEIGDDAERAKRWQRYDRNPVFDESTLADMVKSGVNRLTEMQLSDGGWGWFSGWGEYASAHTTATVVRGLLIAKQNDVAIVPGVVERGVAWLQRYQTEQLAALDNYDREVSKSRDKDKPAKSAADDLDALVYLVLTESKRAGASPPPAAEGEKDAADVRARTRNYLYGDRTKLAVYSLATFGLALQQESQPLAPPGGGAAETPPPEAGAEPIDDMLTMVRRNISQYVRQDDANQTAWLELPREGWWYWYGSEYEAHAYYLKLLAAAEPDGAVAPRLVKYLLNNRKNATYWNSTRDTALVVEAFADYLEASGEAKPNMSLEIVIDGQSAKTVEISAENLFTFDNKLVLEGEELSTGDHVVELRKTGTGPVYFNGYLTNFTLQDPIPAAGLELQVERRYFKLTPAEKTAVVAGGRGQAVEQRVEKYDRTPIENLDELTSGDLVEVELIVDSKNDYEYIVLEDMKPAGFEPVEVRSGYNGNALGAYVEYRDERVALFCRTLARGQHSVAYRLRAEIPGRFSALPTRASAMYAPELKANSEEWKVEIAD